MSELEQSSDQGELLFIDPAFVPELLQANLSKPLLLEFYADWCQPCRDLNSSLERAAKEGKGRFLVAKVDVTDRGELMEEFGLRPSYPTFVLKPPGGSELLKKFGSDEFGPLLNWLKDEKRSTRSPLQFSQDSKRQGFKAVLVAGSSGNANFLQELSLLSRLLAEKGIKKHEIACFSAVPDFVEYHGDKEQFDSLIEFISQCRPAIREDVLATIQTSINQHPKDFYLYISSHGAAPADAQEKEAYKKFCISFAPALILQKAVEGCQASQDITPDTLAAVMMNANGTRKHVILQGCYTGGFISESGDPVHKPSSLAALNNMTILTASRPDRTSFGCNAGANLTVYGYAVVQSLLAQKVPMDRMPWPEVAKDVSRIVMQEEKKISIPEDKSSEPQFFQKVD